MLIIEQIMGHTFCILIIFGLICLLYRIFKYAVDINESLTKKLLYWMKKKNKEKASDPSHATFILFFENPDTSKELNELKKDFIEFDTTFNQFHGKEREGIRNERCSISNFEYWNI